MNINTITKIATILAKSNHISTVVTVQERIDLQGNKVQTYDKIAEVLTKIAVIAILAINRIEQFFALLAAQIKQLKISVNVQKAQFFERITQISYTAVQNNTAADTNAQKADTSKAEALFQPYKLWIDTLSNRIANFVSKSKILVGTITIGSTAIWLFTKIVKGISFVKEIKEAKEFLKNAEWARKAGNMLKTGWQAVTDKGKAMWDTLGKARSIGTAIGDTYTKVQKKVFSALDTAKTWSKTQISNLQNVAGKAWDGIQKGAGAVGKAMSAVGKFLSANPTLIIIMAIAAAALLIWQNWDGIKAFFKRLFDGVRNIFAAVWNWIRNMFLKYTPEGLIISHWRGILAWFTNLWNRVRNAFSTAWHYIQGLFHIDIVGGIMGAWNRIVGFFGSLWDRIIGIFNRGMNFIMGLPAQMLAAGAAFINNLVNGIMGGVHHLVDIVSGVAQRIHNFFPFSPAKDGPLRDLHKVKLMETVAMAITPKPIANALNRALVPAMGLVSAVGANHYGGASIVFAPVINLSGSATKADGDKMVKTLDAEFRRLMSRYQAQQSRINY